MGGQDPRGSRGRRRATLAISIAASALLVWGTGLASGAVGDLTYQGCITAETEVVASGACASVGSTTTNGANSGFDNVRSTAVSPDGTSVYGSAANDSSVFEFARDPATGALTYLGCITGETGVAACTPLPHPGAGGNNSGLGGAQATAISPDGASVYVAAANDDAVARFSRDAGTGILTFQDCITGEDESGPGPAGSDACSKIATSKSAGTDSGLDDPQSIAVTNDSLYVAARGDDAVARFNRTPATGALTYQGCQSGETQTGPLGTNACTLLPGASSGGNNSGLDVLQTVALSPDGTQLYTASQSDSAVGRFSRDTGSGVLTYQGCITGETASSPPCSQIPSATLTGDTSGMQSMYAVAASQDGSSVYAVSENDDALVRFSGLLAYQGCITGQAETGPPPPITDSGACAEIPSATTGGDNSGIRKLRSVIVSLDGGSVYVASPQDDAVARFARDSGSGAVTYLGCITGETQTGPAGTGACAAVPSATSFGGNSGLDNPQSMAISPDAASLYLGAANDAGIARFAVELPPVEEGADTSPPDTTITKHPKKKTKKKRAKFEFTSTEPGSTFQCKIDKGQFVACTSRFEDKVKKGKHNFAVRATDAAGNTDPTPATYRWRVKKKHHKH
jgi:hypothetical protein